jgi:hypothetical protein
MTEYLELRKVAFELINYIVKKYDINSYEEFTCPYTRQLAESIYYFG